MRLKGAGRRWTFVSLLPGMVGLVLSIGVWHYSREAWPQFTHRVSIEDGILSDAQRAAIDSTIQVNQFLLSIATLLIGGLAFYLKRYQGELDKKGPIVSFFIAAALLLTVYFYAYKVYEELTSELAQNHLALWPGRSRILYYLEMEFRTTAVAALVVLMVFFMGLVAGHRSECSAN